ncbi:16562_t:CDS:1, partial [Funneliformis geosporum]
MFSFNFTTILREEVVVKLVKICYPTSKPPDIAHLNLEDNLSSVRKVLEMEKFIDDELSFSQNVDEMSKISNSNEEKFRLKEIIVQNDNEYILSLIHSNLWKYLNEKHKLDYGCTITNDGIKTKDCKVFIMKDCELYDLGIKGVRSGTVEFNSIETEDMFTKTNLTLNINSKLQSFIKLSAGIMNRNKSKLETNSTYHYRNYGKHSLNINIRDHLILTEEFVKSVKNAIESKMPKKFIQIVEDFGQFIPTEVILGGRIYFEVYGSSTDYSTEKANSEAMNLGVPNIAD